MAVRTVKTTGPERVQAAPVGVWTELPMDSTPRLRVVEARDGARRYRDSRPWAVASSLDGLTGPASGFLELPLHLNWSPRRRFDLSVPGQLFAAYVAVLNEASEDELSRYLNRDLLIDVWPRLVLGAECARAWEERHPELRCGAHG